MRFTRPIVLTRGAALEAIQNLRKIEMDQDSPQEVAVTVGAYDADE